MRAFGTVIALAACIGFQPVVQAEFRPWSDTKGNAIEAEYIRLAGDTVLLSKRDGSEIKVSLSSLSDEDRIYVMRLNPPRIDVAVDDQVDRETLRYTGGRSNSGRIQMESIVTEVTLRKITPEAYEPELSMEILLIGRMEQLDRYVIVEKAASTFRFTDENRGIHTYTCGPLDLRNASGNIRGGTEYEGWLMVVRDSRDEIIVLKSSRLEYEKNAEILLKAQKGGVFDDDFNFISASRNTGSPSRQRR